MLVAAASKAQNFADLAALAGASVAIPQGPTAACDTAASYYAANLCGGTDTIQPQVVESIANGYVYRIGSTTVTVRCPYSSPRAASLGYSPSGTVCVEVFHTIRMPLLALANKPNAEIRSRAVAAARAAGVGCLFAKDNRSSVNGIIVNGSQVQCDGTTHSNSKIVINGSKSHFTGLVEYRYQIVVNGSKNQFDMGYVEGQELDYPVSVTRADIDPGVYDYEVNTSYVINGSNQTLPPGRWHIRGNFTVNGSRFRADGCIIIVEGDVTFNGSLASFQNSTIYAEGRITFNGSQAEVISPAVKDIICMSNSTSSPAITFNGSNQTCEGIVFAPRGGIVYNGSNSGIHRGGVVGMTITVNGSGFTIDGTWGGSRVTAKLIE